MNHTATRRRDGAALAILKGVLLAVAATAVMAALFALLISLFNFSDDLIRAVNQLIKLLAVALGVRAAVPAGAEGGIPRGALVGLCYMAAGVMVYALLTGQRLTAFAYLADLLLGVAAGGLIGMLRARQT